MRPHNFVYFALLDCIFAERGSTCRLQLAGLAGWVTHDRSHLAPQRARELPHSVTCRTRAGRLGADSSEEDWRPTLGSARTEGPAA